MESILVSSTVFLVVFGGAVAGMRLRLVLPQNQLGPEVKDVIRLVTGLLVTMTALVLGMLVSTANSSYQQRKDQLTEMASDFVGVDRLLGSYGPETQKAREELHSLAEASLQRIWPNQGIQDQQLRPTDTGQIFYNQLQLLQPKNDAQVAVKGAAISAAIGLRRTYWLMFLGSEGSSLSLPLLLVVVAWLTAIFVSFGLFAPRNSTVFVTLVVCAAAVSGAVFVHVYAVQRGHEDFVFAPSRRTHPHDTLSLPICRTGLQQLLEEVCWGKGHVGAIRPQTGLLHQRVVNTQWPSLDI